MRRPIKSNPYDGFISDRERRLALNTKARCNAVMAIAIAAANAHLDWTEKIRWLISLFH